MLHAVGSAVFSAPLAVGSFVAELVLGPMAPNDCSWPGLSSPILLNISVGPARPRILHINPSIIPNSSRNDKRVQVIVAGFPCGLDERWNFTVTFDNASVLETSVMPLEYDLARGMMSTSVLLPSTLAPGLGEVTVKRDVSVQSKILQSSLRFAIWPVGWTVTCESGCVAIISDQGSKINSTLIINGSAASFSAVPRPVFAVNVECVAAQPDDEEAVGGGICLVDSFTIVEIDCKSDGGILESGGCFEVNVRYGATSKFEVASLMRKISEPSTAAFLVIMLSSALPLTVGVQLRRAPQFAWVRLSDDGDGLNVHLDQGILGNSTFAAWESWCGLLSSSNISLGTGYQCFQTSAKGATILLGSGAQVLPGVSVGLPGWASIQVGGENVQDWPCYDMEEVVVEGALLPSIPQVPSLSRNLSRSCPYISESM